MELTNNNSNIHIVESIESFNYIYNALSEKAIIKPEPVVRPIGLDCEMLNYHQHPESYEKYHNTHPLINQYNQTFVCKLQIYTDDLCILVDLTKFDFIPEKLGELLRNDSWLKTGVGISNDIIALSVNYSLGQCNGCIDMKNMGILFGITSPNLLNVYKAMTGDLSITKEKTDQLSDWSQEFTLEQLKYARNDAYMSYMIGKKMFNVICPAIKNTLFWADIGYKQNESVKINNTIPISSIMQTNYAKQTYKPLCVNIPINDTINYVGKLQEYSQKNNKAMPYYEEINGQTKGTFICKGSFDGKNTTGIGKNKKEAKQNAANKLYDLCLSHKNI